MSNLKWVLGGPSNSQIGDIYVLDIVTGSGSAQMVFATEWTGEDASNFTQTDADNAASELKTVVDGLGSVTSSTLTTLTVAEPASLIQSNSMLVFDRSDYSSYTFKLTLAPGDGYGYTNAYLISSSPIDGILSGADISSVLSSLNTYFAGLTDVTGCTDTQQTVSPSTI